MEYNPQNVDSINISLDSSITVFESESVEELLPVQTIELEQMIEQFLDDAKVPDAARERFADAILGDAEAQYWIEGYGRKSNGFMWYGARTIEAGDPLDWEIENAVFPFRNNSHPYTKRECLYNIGEFYYNGSDYIDFPQDRVKAFIWFTLSAEEGNSYSAVRAGDIVRYGDGMPADEQVAFAFYSQSVAIELSSEALERLGDCYAHGIGTAADEKKAFAYYFDSALMGHPPALYKLSFFTDSSDVNMTALYKAAGSLNNSGSSWANGYGDISGYPVDSAKQDLINKLLHVWTSGSDIAASNMQRSVRYNEHFPLKFAEALIQVFYTYSYHAFAEKYGLQPNDIYGVPPGVLFPSDEEGIDDDWYALGEEEDNSFEYDKYNYYRYDFDDDGVDEIGVPVSSGAGGATMFDGFNIYKKNREGIYEYYAEGPEALNRDAMRLICYDDRVYFILNPYDEDDNAPHDIIAYTVDKKNGQGHEMAIIGKDYRLQRIITHIDAAYSDNFDTIISCIEEQAYGAVAASKQQRIYSPDDEKQLTFESDDLWDQYVPQPGQEQNAFFLADINNSGVEFVIHKGHSKINWKYYDEYNWFQIYENCEEFENGTVVLHRPEFLSAYDSVGVHSGGNLYDLLPVGNNVVQFWTHEYDGMTYCVTLQRYQLLYALQIFVANNGETHSVYKSLFFDEAQEIDVLFRP
jgi:TPR repeat protein